MGRLRARISETRLLVRGGEREEESYDFPVLAWALRWTVQPLTRILWEDKRNVGLLPYNQTQTSTRGTPAGTSPRVPFLENSPPTPFPQQARKHSPPLARGWLLGACRFG